MESADSKPEGLSPFQLALVSLLVLTMAAPAMAFDAASPTSPRPSSAEKKAWKVCICDAWRGALELAKEGVKPDPTLRMDVMAASAAVCVQKRFGWTDARAHEVVEQFLFNDPADGNDDLWITDKECPSQ